MERQHLLTPANETEYDALYRKLLSRKEEIIAAVQTVNFGALPQRFMGEKP